MAQLSHTREQLSKWPTPLNNGEERVFEVLAQLDDGWSVILQPRLLMSQPDFVVMHADHGICVVEVKDWTPGIYRNENGQIQVRSNDDWVTISGKTPAGQIQRYRETVLDRFFATSSVGDVGYAIRGLLVFPQFSNGELRLLFRGSTPPHTGLCNLRDFQSMPEKQLLGSNLASRRDRWYSSCLQQLKWHLREPEFVREQSLPLRLSEAAKDLEKNPSSATIRRARGPAGSGKSLGVAARAATLAAEGKSVLVLCYNITLAHYLRDLTVRHARTTGASIRRISFSHFHGFCRHVVKTSPSDLADRRWVSPEELVQLAHKASQVPNAPQFDAVLVDEGQDFSKDWWNLLRNHVVAPGGEMLLVADRAQDLYEVSDWTTEHEMLGSGFRGKWTELEGSYRLPPDLIPIVADFASHYLPPGSYSLPTVPDDHPMRRDAFEPTLRHWINHSRAEGFGRVIADEVVRLLSVVPGLALADIAFLVEEHDIGLEAAGLLIDRNYDVLHVFTAVDDRKRRARKMRFWGRAPGIKGSTTHSFKGWEARAIVLVVGSTKSSHRLAYVALTRVKGDPGDRSAAVSVINTNESLNSFEQVFMREVSVAEAPGLAGQRSLGHIGL